MRLAILSDLHIRGADDPLYGRFLQWLEREGLGPESVLVLGGDIFDLYVGDKRVFRERYSEFHRLIRRIAANGTQVHYIQGNHDFCLQGVFADTPGIRVWGHSVSLEIDGAKIWVGHGDTVDTSDWGYRALRLFFRSPLMRLFVYFAPDSWILWIGQNLSAKSQERTPRLPETLPAARLTRLRGIYHAAAQGLFRQGYQEVVMGHCHDRDQREWSNWNGTGSRRAYWNVGFPRAHETQIRWSPIARRLERVALDG